ncbi:hypothetical protein HDU96_002643 [Phlyctochytrium bullatum]|nr:hypothetical protein HDU96_002643 [Phlyctochytrium bullatum]
MPKFDPETAENALHHAETFFKLISSGLDVKKLRLTKIDDEIYEDFRKEFPDLPVAQLRETDDFKTAAAKEKWRNWMTKYETKVADYNFGTLLRIRSAEDYSESNAFFVTRIQFYAIEIARNKEGVQYTKPE